MLNACVRRHGQLTDNVRYGAGSRHQALGTGERRIVYNFRQGCSISDGVLRVSVENGLCDDAEHRSRKTVSQSDLGRGGPRHDQLSDTTTDGYILYTGRKKRS